MVEHQTETFRIGTGSDLRLGWQCFTCDTEEANYHTLEAAQIGEREHKRRNGDPVAPAGGPITECVQCRCLVHESKLRLHEDWHAAINARIRGKQDLR